MDDNDEYVYPHLTRDIVFLLLVIAACGFVLAMLDK